MFDDPVYTQMYEYILNLQYYIQVYYFLKYINPDNDVLLGKANECLNTYVSIINALITKVSEWNPTTELSSKAKFNYGCLIGSALVSANYSLNKIDEQYQNDTSNTNWNIGTYHYREEKKILSKLLDAEKIAGSALRGSKKDSAGDIDSKSFNVIVSGGNIGSSENMHIPGTILYSRYGKDISLKENLMKDLEYGVASGLIPNSYQLIPEITTAIATLYNDTGADRRKFYISNFVTEKFLGPLKENFFCPTASIEDAQPTCSPSGTHPADIEKGNKLIIIKSPETPRPTIIYIIYCVNNSNTDTISAYLRINNEVLICCGWTQLDNYAEALLKVNQNSEPASIIRNERDAVNAAEQMRGGAATASTNSEDMDTGTDDNADDISSPISVIYTNKETPLSAKQTLIKMRNVVGEILPYRNEYSWKELFKYLNMDDTEETKRNAIRQAVNVDLASSGIPATHYINSPPSYIRRKMVTAGFAKGLGDELQEILGWAKKSSYTDNANYVYGNAIIPLFQGEPRRLMLSGDRPSALRAIFMMMYADNVGGRSAVGYVGPGGKYYLALRPGPRATLLAATAAPAANASAATAAPAADASAAKNRKRKRGGSRKLKLKPTTRKKMRKKRNTKNKYSKIKLKIKKKPTRAKKRIPKNSRRKPYKKK